MLTVVVSRSKEELHKLIPEIICARSMDPKTDKLVRRTAMVGSVTAAYFLFTADYDPSQNVLDPVKGAIKSAKKFMFNVDTDETGKGIPNSNGAKKES